MNSTHNTVALVTGGSRGIGAAVAKKLAAEGADVVLTYERDADSAAGVVAEIEALGRKALAVRADSADVTAVTGAVDTVVETFGRLDVLVNNAGAFLVGHVDDLGPEEFDRTVAVNIRAPFVASQAAARHMAPGGRIISIGSNVAERSPFPGFSLYSMSKTALIGMTKGLARDLGPKGITVNIVNPGPTDTDANPADGPMADTINGFTALGRYATPDDIASAVAYLAGPGGAYVTGASLNVDGGFTV
ncbi:SDR family NAD(P)-dependent oxidoreductase [Streptomyces sp. ISL-11]|uniref:SDR family NAD(P)-dependent oxidoreductase n=1 Tax=Streptomyces sp. ISL-11 TaxID=2819174 RepID=UPI001BE5CDC1|nr:3-oxoacyl-ACP reductase family protein [Streptomyces sp. ISL-11]MBT2384380.1 3-oxoacyl-ACP reductase FabG [Streptomyces sp. ISL-11]